MRKLFKSGKRKVVTFSLLAILMVAAISGAIFTGNLHDGTDNFPAVSAESIKSQTQAMNGVDKNISFDFISDKPVNKTNYRDYVSVKDISGNIIDCKFEPIEKNKFTIKAPDGGYADGGNYVISVKNVSFAEPSIDSNKPFYFSIKHEDVENVIFNDKVRQISSDAVLDFDGEYVIFRGIDIAIGDIFMFTYENGLSKRDVSVKISEIIFSNGIDTKARVVMPKENEITLKKEIYGTYIPEVTLENIVEAIDEDKLESDLLQTPYVSEISETLGENYAESTLNTNQQFAPMAVPLREKNKLIPEFQFLIEGGYDLKDKESKPWKFSFIFIWTLYENKDINFKTEVKLTISITKDLKTFVSDINGVKNTATISRTTVGVRLEVEGKFEFEVMEMLEKRNATKNADNLIQNEFEGLYDKDGNVTADEKGINDWQMRRDLERNKKLKGPAVTNQIKAAQAAVNERNRIRKEARELKKLNQQSQNTSDPKYRIVNINVPICTGISFAFTLDFFVDITFTGEFGVEYQKTWVDESGTIECNGETRNYHNEDKMLDSGGIQLFAELEIKVGLRARAGFTFIGILTIGVEVEFGVYLEARGGAAWAWGNGVNKDVYDENPGFLYFETGLYVELSVFGEFNFWIFEKEFESKPFFKYKFILAKWGDDAVSDLTMDIKEMRSPMDAETDDTPITIYIDSTGVAQLPTIYKTVYNLATGQEYQFEVERGKYLIGDCDYVYFDNGIAYQFDYSIQEFDDLIYIYLIGDDGKIDMNSAMPILIKKLPIKAEKVEVHIDTRGVEVGGSVSLNTVIIPNSASYKDVEYFVEYVEKDGIRLTGSAIQKYAQIDEMGVLTVSKDLKIDDKIGVKARAIKDDVVSDVRVINVIKTPVGSVILLADENRASIQPNETLRLYTAISPSNATVQDAKLTVLQGTQYVIVDGFNITALPSAPQNAQIKLIATADGIDSPVRTITVGAIPVENVKIFSVEIQQELSTNVATSIQIGAAMQLSAIAYPTNATMNEPQFRITQGSLYAEVNASGELKINKNAKVGETIKIIANISGTNSREYTFVTTKMPVENVTLVAYENKTSVIQGDNLQLFPIVKPSDATNLTVMFAITEGKDYASISPTGVLSIYGNSPVGAIVKVTASCDGIISDKLSITIISRPVESVVLDAAGVKMINKGESTQLSVNILPINATNQNIYYEFVSGGSIAHVDENGVLHISNNASGLEKIISLRAVVDGIESNVLTFDIYFPVNSVEVKLENSASKMQQGEFLRLAAVINPGYATNPEVSFEITNNFDYATLDDNFGILSINYDAPAGERIGVVAIVNGIRSPEFFITVLKIPVKSIEIQGGMEIKVAQGKTYCLSAIAYPLYATYPNISYEIISGAGLCTIDPTTHLLSVNNNAPIGSVIRIRALADGVYSDVMTVTIVSDSVTYLEIYAEKTVLYPSEQIALYYEINEDASDRTITYRIIEGAGYAFITPEGLLTINNEIPHGNVQIMVIANAGGRDSNILIFDIFVPIDSIILTSDKYSVVKGGTFTLSEEVNSNATDKIVIITVVEGAEYIASVSGNSYVIVSGITIPNAKIVFEASAQGIKSERLEISIIVPVQNVNVSVNNVTPKQGETINYSARYYPDYATTQDIKFELVSGIAGVTLDSISGELKIAYNVPEGTRIRVMASCGSVIGYAADVIVQRIQVASVEIMSTVHEIRQGESLQLMALVLPENATYKEINFLFESGAQYATISQNGLINIKQNAVVGAKIYIRAVTIEEGVTSARYEINVLKVPVEYVYISANNIYTLRPGQTLLFKSEVSEFATYSNVVFSIKSGGEYATISANGLLTINSIINSRFATIEVIGVADGVVSNVYEISIYNPAKSISVTSDKYTVKRGETFTLSSVISPYSTSQDVLYEILSGAQHVLALTNGKYMVKDDIKVSNAQIILRGCIDDIYSENIIISVYIEVASINITNYNTEIAPGNSMQLSSTILPAFATNQQITYSLKNAITGVSLSNSGLLTVSSAVKHNTAIRIIANAADGKSSEVEITVKITDVVFSVSNTSNGIVMQNAYLEIFLNNRDSFSFIRYEITEISHQGMNYASIEKDGTKAYLNISNNVTVKNYKFSLRVYADNLVSNEMIFTVYVPVTWAILSADNPTPISTGAIGDAVTLSIETNANATNQTPIYSIIEGQGYVENLNGNILRLKKGINVPNAKVVICAVVDGYVCDYLELNIAIPVAKVELGVSSGQPETHELQQEAWLSLSAVVYPAYATNKNVVYSIVYGNKNGSVNQNGVVTIFQNAVVGDEIRIIATVDGVSSNEYIIVIRKVPVTKVTIYSTIASDLKPGQSTLFFGEVNNGEYATYSNITYRITSESMQYATITPGGMLTIKSTINAQNAKVYVYGEADGVYSAYHEVSIYNPAKNVVLTASKISNVRPGEIITFAYNVGDYSTDQTAQLVFSSGGHYLTSLGNGMYKIKPHIEILKPDATITVYAQHADGIKSANIVISIFIDVENIVIENTESEITQGATLNVIARLTPAYATGASLVYVLKNSITGVSINSSTGKITVDANAPIDTKIYAYVKAIVGGTEIARSADSVFTIAKIKVSSVSLNVSSSMSLAKGDEVTLIATVLPQAAAEKDYNSLSYVVSDSSIIKIINNKLTVLNVTEAMVGKTVTYYAVAGGKQSTVYSIILTKISVSTVTLTAQGNITSAEPGSSVVFYTSISPNNATMQSPTLSVISGSSMGYLDGNILIINDNAKHKSIITVQASADGKTAQYSITVRITSIVIASSKNTVTEGEKIQLTGISNNMFTNVVYSSSSGFASISNSGLITISSNVTSRNVTFTVKATADDLTSNTIAFTIYIPVKSMTITANGMSSDAKAVMNPNSTSTIVLDTIINAAATNQNVTYSLVSGSSYGMLSGNTITLNRTTNDNNPSITVKATINDNGSLVTRTLVIAIIIPVTIVAITIPLPPIAPPAFNPPIQSILPQTPDIDDRYIYNKEVYPNKTYELTITVLPANATYKDISFTVLGSASCVMSGGTSIELEVNTYAAAGSFIDLTAKSAGFTINGKQYAGCSSLTERFTVIAQLAEFVEITSVKKSNGTIIDNNANKARPGDVLIPIVEIGPYYVTNKNYELSVSNTSLAYVSGDSIIIRSLSYMNSDNPQFTIWADALDGSGEYGSWIVKIYVPVMSFTMNATTIDRGNTYTPTQLGIGFNNGYATAKDFTGSITSITNSKVTISSADKLGYYFNGVNLIVPKNAPGGTQITIKLISKDNSLVTITKTLSINALLKINYSVVYDNDSAGRVLYSTNSAQLEEGKYTYVRGKYNSENVSVYGVTYTATETSSYATLDPLLYKLSITSGAPGNEIVNITVVFNDGTFTSVHTIVKQVQVFNGISGANLTTTTTTSVYSYVYASKADSLSSNSSDSYSFVAYSDANYSITSNGYLTIKHKNKNLQNASVTLIYTQLYNGNRIETFRGTKSIYVNLKLSELVVFHASGDNAKVNDSGIDWDDYGYINLNLFTFRDLGYTKLTFKIRVDIQEIDDGYQEVFLYSQKGFYIFEKTNIEHGPGKKDTSWKTYEYSVTINLTDIFVGTNSYYSGIRLGYGANGNFADDWNRGIAEVTVTVS